MVCRETENLKRTDLLTLVHHPLRVQFQIVLIIVRIINSEIPHRNHPISSYIMERFKFAMNMLTSKEQTTFDL